VRLAVLAAIGVVGLSAAGCGTRASDTVLKTNPQTDATPALHGHPQAVEPVAGALGETSTGSSGGGSVSVGPPVKGLAAPQSDVQIRQELSTSGLTASTNQATLTPSGLAIPPVNAPPAVQAVIEAGNQIARLPYRFGGGHGTFVDTAYDCSGSISFAFAAAGLLQQTMTSGELMSWGKAGTGKWITVFANQGHTFMYIAGLRFDTVARAETGSRWSNHPADESDLNTFVARHPPGL
jgi:hypothetical protein